MRFAEFVVEEHQPKPATFADGTLRLSQHLQNRSVQREIPMTDIMKVLQRLEALRGKDLRQLPPTSFVVKTPEGFELAMAKTQNLDTKKIEYVVITVRQRLKPGAGQRIIYLEDQVNELNYPDELTVSDALQQYFTKRGYQVAGEGRDQIAFESPRGTVVKVVGLGATHREDVVKQYVNFFVRNQRNPYYPRIYNTGEFPVGDETYFVYEQEYLTYISDEEEVLEYIEDLMSAVPRGEQAVHAFQQNRHLPKSLDPGEIDGLVMATQDLEDHLGGAASLDLSMIENIRRRNNGHLVIMDPYSL
jgi:hypothetical protein